ncbi:MAG: peptidase MA family metallohydrolase [Mycobacterium leprae]
MSTTLMSKRLLAPIASLLIPVILWWVWPYSRGMAYSLYRAYEKQRTLHALNGYANKESAHFDLWYTNADAYNVDLILQTAEAVYGPVEKLMGTQAIDKVPLIVYADRGVLRKAFGWGSSESAMGVYWTGTIRLLSPNAWISSQNQNTRQRVFTELNPIAHELTHYLLDYMTNGNYPRWFTEGLAQQVEHQVTGYLWLEPQSTLRQPLYTLDDLQSRFDQLSNQPLAYRESYLLVDYLSKTYGEKELAALVQRLAKGVPFDDAIHQTFGKTMAQVFADWQTWVHAHLDQIDPMD